MAEVEAVDTEAVVVQAMEGRAVMVDMEAEAVEAAAAAAVVEDMEDEVAAEAMVVVVCTSLLSFDLLLSLFYLNLLVTRIFGEKEVYCFQPNYDFYPLLLILVGITFVLFCWFDDAIALYCFGKVHFLLLVGCLTCIC